MPARLLSISLVAKPHPDEEDAFGLALRARDSPEDRARKQARSDARERGDWEPLLVQALATLAIPLHEGLQIAGPEEVAFTLPSPGTLIQSDDLGAQADAYRHETAVLARMLDVLGVDVQSRADASA